MKKMWAKILKNHKIIKDVILNLEENFDAENLYEPLKDVCCELKIETPIILNKHIKQMEEYSTTRFVNVDFIDLIDFDSLIVEVFE